ncbi:glycosyltransferase family 2 protein [Nibribacter koreensis]|uniref:Glycosyltransferase family 2 protein n=1 Tax=Nibribacter koreensis TaxID=1084519 RepID=A0ABP8FS56_9BACT
MERNSNVAISVIVPIYNEEKNLPELYRRLTDTLLGLGLPYELVFVNDGSKDNSLLEILRLSQTDSAVFYVNFSRNFGHQIAVTAGLDVCRGACAVIIDGDLQDPPELIADLYQKYQKGHEVVYAKRATRNGDSFFKKTTAKLFYRVLRASTATDIPLDTGDFRLIDRKVIDYLKQMPEQNKFLRGQIAWLGFSQTHVLFDRDSRRHGTSGYSLGRMLRFAMDGITGFSDAPLQFVTRLGFTISALSFLIILYAVYSHFILHRTITGWTSLIISSMFIGGVQLLSVGVIGEYVSRINRNVLNRPLYIVQGSNLSQNAVAVNGGSRVSATHM